MTTGCIPLFKLPQKALAKVSQIFEVNEIVNVSLCSKNSKKSLKELGNQYKNANLFMPGILNNPLTIQFLTDKEGHWPISILPISKLSTGEKYKTVRIGGSIVPITQGDFGLQSFWGNTTVGLKLVVEYLVDLFDTPIQHISLSASKYSEIRNVLEWNCINPVEQCDLDIETEVTDEEMTHFLKNLKVSDTLNLNIKPRPQFRHCRSFELGQLKMTHAYWLDGDNLLRMNCQIMHLKDSKFTNRNLNDFLKSWIKGGCPYLKNLSFDMEEKLDIEEMFEGITVAMRAKDVERDFALDNCSLRSILIKGGFDIKRNDGVTATVFRIEKKNMESEFGLVKWPDWKNRSYSWME